MRKRPIALAWWAAALAAACPAPARAISSATIDVEVIITANLSVEIDGLQTSTAPVHWAASTPNQPFASVSSATLRNNSGAVTEVWSLSTDANSENVSTVGGSSWSIVGSTASVGADQVAVQAVIGSSNTAASGCPAGTAADWNASYAPPLTPAPQEYSSSLFADPNLNANGTPDPDNAADQIYAGHARALCWRVIMPGSTSTTDTQVIPVTITAALPP